MEMNKTEQSSAREVDVVRLLRMLWKRVWVIILAMAIFGSCAWAYSSFMVDPTYRTSFSAYINNKEISAEDIPNYSTTTSDLNASRGLMYVYQEIVESRAVLQQASQLSGISLGTVSVSAHVSESAPILRVYVVSKNPADSRAMADAIAQVAPAQVAEVVKGSTMTLIDTPLTPRAPFAPNIFRSVLYGILLGMLASVIALVIIDVVYDHVLENDDMESRYHIPVVGRIPDFHLALRNDVRYGQTKERGLRR